MAQAHIHGGLLAPSPLAVDRVSICLGQAGLIRQGALRTLLLAFGLMLVTCDAQAHVKWFAPYNVAANPTPLPEVFSGPFVFLLTVSILLMVLVYICDRMIEAAPLANLSEKVFAAIAPHSPDIMRVMLGAFMLGLWLKGGIILTPELQTDSEAVSWFQLALAVSTVMWRTTWIAGLGIIVLYVVSLTSYGLFHLMDYPLFLGIAAYLIIVSLKIERLQPYALSILYVATAVTLLWASVEKWAFEAWTMPLLVQYERITLGFDHRIYMMMAGFVEFTAAFLLIFGRTSQRLAAIMLIFIFLAAIVEFGKIDAVGHAMILASLAVVAINGNTIVNRKLQNRIPSLSFGALEMGGSYLGCLLLFFIVYYGVHGVMYGSLA